DEAEKGGAAGLLLFPPRVGAVGAPPHRSKPNYDTLRDFAPITLVARPTTILVVKPDTPVNSAKELAALARDKPATIPFASTGSGSVTHLALELYQSAANVKFLHVPYRGAPPAVTRRGIPGGGGRIPGRVGSTGSAPHPPSAPPCWPT